ncbi:MAG: SPASM domain-containing protein [Thermodesulfobacteriota bacterium]
MPEKLTTPWYALEIPHARVLYFPLRRAAAIVTPEAADACRKLAQDPQTALVEEGARLAALLCEMGVLGPDPDRSERRGLPDQLTLLPTLSCNLCCSYCYVSPDPAGDMSPETMDRIVSSGFARARESGSRFFRISFHGGEAFTRLDLVRRAVERAKELCRSYGMEARFAAASNGAFGQEVRSFILENFHGLVLSFDGPKGVHDSQRPGKAGASSFGLVSENIRVLSRLGFPLALRMTLTERSATFVDEAVQLLAGLGFRGPLLLEPVFAGSGNVSPSVEPSAFLSAFARAFSSGRSSGIRVSYSPARLSEIVMDYCGAGGENACVAPDGRVYACLQAAARGSPEAQEFLIGDVSTGILREEGKAAAIRQRIAERREACRGCFAFYHCAGGCPLIQKKPDPENDSRCETARAVLLFLILTRIRESGGLFWREESPAKPD